MTDLNHHNRPPYVLIMTLSLVLLLGIIVSAGMGYLAISPMEVAQVIWAHVSGSPLDSSLDPTFGYVVWDVRLPRILTAVLVGGSLAVAGVLFQAILLNPLADPYTLGGLLRCCLWRLPGVAY